MVIGGNWRDQQDKTFSISEVRDNISNIILKEVDVSGADDVSNEVVEPMIEEYIERNEEEIGRVGGQAKDEVLVDSAFIA